MHIDPAFYHTVTKLLDSIGLDSSRVVADKQEVYCINLDDDIHINLLGIQEGCLTMMSFVGKLPEEAGKESLFALLQANLFSFEMPHITVSLDNANSQVVLWSRIALNEATDESTSKLFRRLVETSDAIRTWLQKGAPASILAPVNVAEAGDPLLLQSTKTI